MRYTLNENFFEIPNLTNSYWAGFIAADGNLYQGSSKILQFGIHVKDRYILEKFKEDIKSTYPIKEANYNGKNHVRLRMSISSKTWDDLYNIWSLHPRKTLNLLPPKLSNVQHQLAYIIGLIDGDGSICLCKYKNNYNLEYSRIKFTICGTKDIIEWCSNILHNLENPKYKPFTIESNKNNTLYYIRCDKLRAQNLINKLLEVNIPWRLPRKWDLIKNLNSNEISTRKRYNKPPTSGGTPM